MGDIPFLPKNSVSMIPLATCVTFIIPPIAFFGVKFSLHRHLSNVSPPDYPVLFSLCACPIIGDTSFRQSPLRPLRTNPLDVVWTHGASHPRSSHSAIVPSLASLSSRYYCPRSLGNYLEPSDGGSFTWNRMYSPLRICAGRPAFKFWFFFFWVPAACCFSILCSLRRHLPNSMKSLPSPPQVVCC